MKFVQVTDMHLVVPGERLYEIDPLERLEACISDINAHHSDAELCVFTGDLADQGEIEAYSALRRSLTALIPPYRLLIGNHDDRKGFLSVFSDVDTDEHGFVQSVLPTSAGHFIFLDTADQGTHAGNYCERRRAWLRSQLVKAEGESVYLFMHHPPFDIGIPSLDRIRLKESEHFADTIRNSFNIRHLFFGHVQRPVTGSWHGISFSSVRGTNHQVALDCATLQPVPYTRDPPAYAIIFIQDETTVVHFHEYLDPPQLVRRHLPDDQRNVSHFEGGASGENQAEESGPNSGSRSTISWTERSTRQTLFTTGPESG